MSQAESINSLFHSTEWPDLVALEKKFYEDNLLQMNRVSLDDPAFDRKTAYYRGLAHAVHQIWALRDTVRRSLKTEKGGEDADDET